MDTLAPGTVVVGVDGSLHSDIALTWAATYAQDHGRRLAIVHASALLVGMTTEPAGGRATRAAGEAVADGIFNASRFAELDPYRAATHNKGIMNGVDSVVIATGNDWRAVEAGAHAYAASSGQYSPLAIWRREGAELVGRLELPLALGTVGGTLRVHPVARLALRMLSVETASELAAVAAAVGLASNLAAVRALATDGIQRGHMALHARSVAVAAGAEGLLVARVAAMIVEARDITLEAAKRALLVVGSAGEGAVLVDAIDEE